MESMWNGPLGAGIAIFLAVKLIGYGGLLHGWLRAPWRTTLAATGARVGMGLVAGLGMLWSGLKFGGSTPVVAAMMLLLGGLAWAITFRQFYPVEWRRRKGRLMAGALAATLVLNALAWAGLFSRTGWIC